jgi:hypothetical protein
MPINQERMLALIHEIEKLKHQISNAKSWAEANGHHSAAELLQATDTPAYWLEKGHFAKVAKANMRRALSHRAERNSRAERPLLALRPIEESHAQVAGQKPPTVLDIAISKAVKEYEEHNPNGELTPAEEILYDQIKAANPEWPWTQIIAEVKRRSEQTAPIKGDLF